MYFFPLGFSHAKNSEQKVERIGTHVPYTSIIKIIVRVKRLTMIPVSLMR